ncbi:MAG: thiamine pyrophosphate-dependent enzyme, partial [Clostridia bacterium]|nr:thiamine pyrophosphate-dependent enzyme [Clostridia bacterium]
YSPTTPKSDASSTTPYGNLDRYFDLASLALGAGASYAARGDVYHVQQTTALIQRGILHKGFSIIDCASICPTYYGRKNKKGDAVEMLRWQKENAITQEGVAQVSAADMQGKLIIGLLAHTNYPEFTAEYQKMLDKLAREGETNAQ